jgi:extracellular factor (EF) 3-hydroxypalmitic acid methyl ester biosynthesis protein
MTADALVMLSARDWELLGSHMQTVAYRRGDVLMQEGVQRRSLLIVRSGLVRVERLMQGQPIVLAQLGVGEVLGDIGFVGNEPASASVVAQQACTVDRIEGDALHALIGAEPAFAARFYHSLAISLARRLRAADLARMQAAAGARAHRLHVSRTGNLSARQVPNEVHEGLESFERTMLACKLAARAGAPQQESARVGAACDAVVALLTAYGQGDAVIDIGYSDLLAFRDSGHIESGIGDFVFRETFSTFMLSATMARCYAKPRGFADDIDTVSAIHRNEAEGDDWLGPLIDRWFLDRPLCRSRRRAMHGMQALLEGIFATAPAGEELRVASLASGAALELFGALERYPQARVAAVCIDLDESALLAGARRAQAAQAAHAHLRERISFQLGNAVPGDGANLALPAQHLIYALGLAEYLSDDQLVRMLDLAHAALGAGGRLVLTQLALGNPDEALMKHLLDWEVKHRSADELASLFARSRFALCRVDLVLDDEQVTLTASVVKAA